jgi:hypothetical protein
MQATAVIPVIPATAASTRIWFRLALLYFVAGTGLGVFMGVSQDHAMFPVHAHLNLLGWVSLALTGFIYDRFPAAIATRLYPVHLWMYNLALPVAMISLALLFKGYEAFGPVVGIASIVLFASIVTFVFNVWRNGDA